MGYGDCIPLSLLRASCLVFWVAEKDVTRVAARKVSRYLPWSLFFGVVPLTSKT